MTSPDNTVTLIVQHPGRRMLVVSLVVVASFAHAQNDAAKDDSTKKAAPPVPPKTAVQPLAQKLLASFQKPKIGAPDLREMQAMRGSKAADGMEVKLLAPAREATGHVGFTVKPSPVLYWHQNKPCTGRIEIAITDAQTMMPIFKYRNKGPVAEGFNKLDLAKHNVVLQPMRDYKWSVIYHVDRDNPSSNLVESTTIRRLEGQTPPDKGDATERAMALSHIGAWLDVTDLLASGAQDAGKGSEEARTLAEWLEANGIGKAR